MEGDHDTSNSAALSHTQQALDDVSGRSTISKDHERALRNLADAVENLAHAVMDLANRQD